ncbi:MAG: hypothetical protein QOJ76_657 [Acidobacteriota bacterium]|jgi:hypothetical protein|nr:hypothetical protein [Acidobacteriota bacterium]
MSDEKILLLNYDSGAGLGAAFHAALQSQAREGLDIRYETARFEETGVDDARSTSDLSSSHPSLMCWF